MEYFLMLCFKNSLTFCELLHINKLLHMGFGKNNIRKCITRRFSLRCRHPLQWKSCYLALEWFCCISLSSQQG